MQGRLETPLTKVRPPFLAALPAPLPTLDAPFPRCLVERACCYFSCRCHALTRGFVIWQVKFYWVCRDEAEFDSFKELLVGIVKNAALASIFELNT